MGRFVFNKSTQTTTPISEDQLRRPEADTDLTGTNYYQARSQAYTQTNAGFHPGKPDSHSSDQLANTDTDPSTSKISYLKAEIDFMVDGFMRELIDFDAFSHIDPQIQSEIINRYPQFFN